MSLEVYYKLELMKVVVKQAPDPAAFLPDKAFGSGWVSCMINAFNYASYITPPNPNDNKWLEIPRQNVLGEVHIEQELDKAWILKGEIRDIDRYFFAGMYGTQVRLTVGYLGDKDENIRRVFSGYVMEFNPILEDSGEVKIEFTAMDYSFLVGRARLSVTYPTKLHITRPIFSLPGSPGYPYTFADGGVKELWEKYYGYMDRAFAMESESLELVRVIKGIADAHKLETVHLEETIVGEKNKVYTLESPLRQVDISDWEFLQQLGKDHGFYVYMDEYNRLIFKSMGEATIDPLSLNEDVEFYYHSVDYPKATQPFPVDPSGEGEELPLPYTPVMRNIRINMAAASTNMGMMYEIRNDDGTMEYRMDQPDTNPQSASFGKVVTYTLREDTVYLHDDRGQRIGFTEAFLAYDEIFRHRELTDMTHMMFWTPAALGKKDCKDETSRRPWYRSWGLTCSVYGSFLIRIGFKYNIRNIDPLAGEWLLTKITHTLTNTWKSTLEFIR
jgi:hypothetical protein